MGEKIRILLAEDNADLRAIARLLIEDESDLECVGEVDRAGEVLPQAAASRADVVVLDVELHGESSFEVLRAAALRADAPAFIMFTGHAHPEIKRSAASLGARDFVVKSGDFDELIAAIRRCGKRAGAARV
jgi:two-component system response regulator DesR